MTKRKPSKCCGKCNSCPLPTGNYPEKPNSCHPPHELLRIT